jgi:asparagine synthase (glutamine-hydrolysing)
MCGVTGYITTESHGDGLANALERSVSTLRHRGPDDRGVWFGEGVGLGHTRLSILDLSAFGHQPMVSADGRDAIVFNGEIYNFRSIRGDLEKLGHAFRGFGDTEVVLAALRQWGEHAVHRFAGMFAIAWWNTERKTLTLIRDRLGVKPLYFAWDGRFFWFGSELKALRAFDCWRAELDQDALNDFFQYGYIAAPLTIYRNVRKLLPGCMLEFRQGGVMRETPYWTGWELPPSPCPRNEEEAAEETEALMRDAFRARMVSDVPVGVFLSGGVDSSLVSALLVKEGFDVHTFTMGFVEPEFDESPHAEAVARHLGTHHLTQKISARDALALVPRWGELFDEPLGDTAGIPGLLVSQLAGQSVKVVLSADGGDELMSGYAAYTGAMGRLRKINRLPPPMRGLLAHGLEFTRGLTGCRQAPAGMHGRFLWKARQLLPLLREPRLGKVYESILSVWPGGELANLTGRPYESRDDADAFVGDAFGRMSRWDIRYYLPDDILAKVDRTTMAASIEGREPLLDHRLVELCLRLPTAMKHGPLGSKHLFRKILYRYVPRELVDRPKQGFNVPIANWLSTDLEPLVNQYLDPDRIRAGGILNSATVTGVLNRFRQGNVSDQYRLWLLLAFELWRERWGM